MRSYMVKHEFQVGDIVSLVIDHTRCGTVMDIIGNNIGVRFDKPFSGGHTLSGTCEDGHGWYYTSSSLTLKHREEQITIHGDVLALIEL